MIVKKLTWLSEVAREAELIISDGKYECVAFSQPCDVREGDDLKEPLHAFMVNNLMISRESSCSIMPLQPNKLAQQCIAEVVDAENGLVKVGNIEIALEGKAPPRALPGDLVEFSCARLDLW
tara:strand:- start:966 stop:1331 length:366 start_codon:yes stop_codon:yes gene_type:complete